MSQLYGKYDNKKLSDELVNENVFNVTGDKGISKIYKGWVLLGI